MSRKEKKYHFIYKTTDTRNENFYIGMHSTDDLNDGYVGSGTRLRKLIYKHGKIIFKLEILEHLPDRESLIKREIEIVNSDLLMEEKCMNLKPGGSGGFCDDDHKHNFFESSKKTQFSTIYNPSYSESDKLKKSEFQKQMWKNGKGQLPPQWPKGKKHTNESKILMSDKGKLRIGEKNSQFGTCWINNNIENKKIKKINFTLFENNGWVLGRIHGKRKIIQRC
jgi:hypothetical protein